MIFERLIFSPDGDWMAYLLFLPPGHKGTKSHQGHLQKHLNKIY